MSLRDTIKARTMRVFADDLHKFNGNIHTWQGQLEDLSIGEGEAVNAAMTIVNKLADPAERPAVADELGIQKEDFKEFDKLCEMIMAGYLNELRSVMSRRDALDKRKNRSSQ